MRASDAEAAQAWDNRMQAVRQGCAAAVAELGEDHFDAVLATQPEIVLLGTGPTNIFPPRELTFAFARKGIGLEVMDTAAAARTFNVLANEGRRVAAVLYLAT